MLLWDTNRAVIEASRYEIVLRKIDAGLGKMKGMKQGHENNWVIQ